MANIGESEQGQANGGYQAGGDAGGAEEGTVQASDFVGENPGVDETAAGAGAAPDQEAISDEGHQPMSNAGFPGSGGGGRQTVQMESADNSSFEAVAGWDESALTEARPDEQEPTIEAYFADPDVKEFLPALGALMPLISGTLPTIAKAILPQLGQAAGGAFGQIFRGMAPARRRGRRPESMEELQQEEAAAVAQQLEVIIGTDDRQRVTNTTQNSWKRICHLRITTANNRLFLGTGFFIGPRTIITAGHCVFLHTEGGWPRSIEVTPGRNANTQPFNKATCTQFRSVRGWVQNKSRDFDYGAIILPARNAIPTQQIGTFGFASLPDNQLVGKRLNTAGYPGDKPPGTMWYHGRRALQCTPRTIVYDIDTAGGQSGSPVWLLVNGQRVCVGVHTNGAPAGNSATRITRPVLENFRRWQAEAGVAPQVAAGQQPQPSFM